ncbi:sensor domain-containing protein [Albimonas pacifica]|uniref:Diguanylate cyclase (GGDEF) domain-containing protein n=1 Tax=Albimonas pacifica TaxID=1114924 RepID=A0A1I3P550_9RHOB|nr:EAL domain-containing protein [Albimonas pacifica]SFJ16532.1 diguanylate cyclase (GGDEF) domain-containing protein [Albimonas pacifica]
MEDFASLSGALLGVAGEAAALTGPEGAILALTPAFARRFGRDDAWRPGPDARLDGLATPPLAEALRRAADRALAEPGRELRVEGELLHLASGRAASAWRVSALVAGGRAVGVLHRLEPTVRPVPAPARPLRRRDADRLRMLETLTAHAPVALFEYRVGPDGQITLPFVNPVALDLFGVPAEGLERDGRKLFAHIPPEDVAEIAAVTERTSRSLRSGSVRYRIDHPVKGLRHVIGEGAPMRLPGGGVTYRCIALDITDRHEAERHAERMDAELVRILERLSRVAEVAPVGLYEFREAPDGSWSFPYLSPRMRDLVGLDPEGEEGEPVRDVFRNVLPEDVRGILESIRRSSAAGQRWTRRMRIVHPERGLVWLRGDSLPERQPDGAVLWTGALYDVTEDVRREAELAEAHARADAMRAENERQALQDGLTGLPNRRAYDRLFADRVFAARAGTGPEDAALVRLDLDHFKHVNDTLGHEAGDLVLQRVAQVLRETLRPGDFTARIGGDEFSILLAPGADPAAAETIVARIQQGLAAPFQHHGRPCRVGASFGLAHTGELGVVGTELQVFADAALYRAKESGRSRLELFTPELHRGILADRRLAVQIQDALERDAFVPYFQPQVRARDRGLHGAEVLLRWPHPSLGLLSPPEFLRVAEQLRVVPRIDRRLMERVREVLARWTAQGFVAPRLSFNMSAGRIRDPDVVETSRLLSAGPTRIAMELLESTLIEEEGDLFRFNLDRIREAGIDIEIDDFGSGHASIVGLTQVAPDVLKIDRRLVAPVAEDPRSRNLIRAILEIAQTLGISTVAEGVETEAQARALAELGCDVLQGYHFGAPMDEDAFLAFARAWIARVA